MERLLLVEHNLLFRDGLALLLKWQTGLHSVLARSLAEAQYVLDDVGHKPLCVIVGLDLSDICRMGTGPNSSGNSMGYRCWRSSEVAARTRNAELRR